MQEFIQQTISFLEQHKEEILIGLLVAISLAVFGAVWKYISKRLSKLKMRRGELKKYYEVIWEKSSKLIPEEVLGLRGKEEYVGGRCPHLPHVKGTHSRAVGYPCFLKCKESTPRGGPPGD